MAAISDADYLLIPVGGYFTIDAKMAVKICVVVFPRPGDYHNISAKRFKHSNHSNRCATTAKHQNFFAGYL